MSLSDDFKEALKAGKLVDALVIAMSRAIELKITTSVIEVDEKSAITTPEVKPGYRLRTHINLIGGDIDHEIGEQFLQQKAYAHLRQFHRQQAAQGSRIVNNNLRNLQKLLGIWLTIKQQDPKLANPELKSVDAKILLDCAALEPETVFISTPKVKPKEENKAPVATPEASLKNTPVDNTPIDSPEDNVTPLAISETEKIPTTSEDFPLLDEEEVAEIDDWDDSIFDIFQNPETEELATEIETTPAPEMPVSDLEIEDWENYLPVFPTPETDTEIEILSLEDMEVEETELISESVTDDPEATAGEGVFLEKQMQQEDVSAEEVSSNIVGKVPTETEFLQVEEEDWGDLLETLAEEEISTNSNSEEEDWGNLLETSSDDQEIATNSNLQEDWGGLLDESPTTQSETLAEEEIATHSSSEEEDWGDLLETSSDDQEIATNSNLQEDWGGLLDESPATLLESPAEEEITTNSNQQQEDDGDVFLDESPATLLEQSPLEEEITANSNQPEDWGDLLDESPTTQSEVTAEEEITTNSNDEEDWGDWINEPKSSPSSFSQFPLQPLFGRPTTADNESSLEEIIPSLDALDWEGNEAWDNFEETTENPSTIVSNPSPVTDGEGEENWDDLALDELESYPSDNSTQESSETNAFEVTLTADDDFGFLFDDIETENKEDENIGFTNSAPNLASQWDYGRDQDEISAVMEDDLFGNFTVNRSKDSSKKNKEDEHTQEG